MLFIPFIEKVEKLGTGGSADMVVAHPQMRKGTLVIDHVYSSVNVAATVDIEIGLLNGIEQIPLQSGYVERAGQGITVTPRITVIPGYYVYAKVNAAISTYTLRLAVFGHYEIPD